MEERSEGKAEEYTLNSARILRATPRGEIFIARGTSAGALRVRGGMENSHRTGTDLRSR